MPTRHERIGVVKDDELSAALESVAGLVAPGVPTAKLVRDLALRGAQALREEGERRGEALRQLAEWSTGDNPPWDPAVLARIDELTSE
jgi:hypothetical protein